MITDWNKGYDDGRESVLCELLRESSKLQVINALFGKSAELASKMTVPKHKEAMSPYSEGIRHCLNILKNRGADSLAAYQGIINPSIHFELTQDDVKRFR